MAEITFEGVQKNFGKFAAVDGVDLEVHDREFVVLLGPSGCGKTTLLRCLAGLERVDHGRVFIGGRDATDLPPRRRRIAMVFQSYAVFPHMKVYDNIAFGLRMQKEKKPVIDERVRSSAGLLHIEELLDRYSSQLSGGQRQRVAVARAIATKADVLLMDEPLSNLDALLRLEMRAELKSLLHGLEATTIYVTHDQIEALSMGDRIAVMNKGRIVQLGNPLEVYDNPADTFVGGFIGNPPMNFLDAEVAVNGAVDRQAQRRVARAARRDRCAGRPQPPARHPGRGDRRGDRGCRRARAGEGDRPRAARLVQPADGALRRGHPEGLDPAGPIPATGERRLAAPRTGANSLDGSRYGSRDSHGRGGARDRDRGRHDVSRIDPTTGSASSATLIKI